MNSNHNIVSNESNKKRKKIEEEENDRDGDDDEYFEYSDDDDNDEEEDESDYSDDDEEDESDYSDDDEDDGDYSDDDDDEEMLQISGGVMCKLPIEIFLNILSKLPIKTLSQCRWVCKSWYKTIQSPRFTKLHHSITPVQTNSPSLILHDRYSRNFYMVDHQVFDSLQTSTTVSISQFNRPKQALQVVGSCNGLMCLSPEPYLICNPITGERIKLPKSPNHRVQGTIAGFGFDSTTNKYKVIRILQNWSEKSFKVEIYTLGSRKWRSIRGAPYMLSYARSHVFLNGSLHWMTNEFADPNVSQCILSFDMGSEKFEAIPSLPGLVSGMMCMTKTLGLLGDWLCFIDYESNEKTEIWVMKDYGVKGSWNKEFVIRHNKPMLGACHLIKLMENGEILVHCDYRVLGYYNPKTDGFRPIVTRGFPFRNRDLIPIVHVGSLISPKSVCR